MDLHVRPARAADHKAVATLLRELALLHAGLHPGFFAPAPPAPPALPCADPDEAVFLAEALGQVLGVIHLRVFSTPRTDGLVQRRRAHIEALVVDPRARRRGCGRTLVHHALRWARGRGATQVVLTVWQGNEDAAAFYQALGLCPVGTVLAAEVV